MGRDFKFYYHDPYDKIVNSLAPFGEHVPFMVSKHNDAIEHGHFTTFGLTTRIQTLSKYLNEIIQPSTNDESDSDSSSVSDTSMTLTDLAEAIMISYILKVASNSDVWIRYD